MSPRDLTTAQQSHGERLGVLGGTFDPIHVGHLALGIAAAHQLHLDRVLFVVSNVSWQKVGQRQITSAEIRLEMVSRTLSAAVAINPELACLEPCGLEIARGGDSFTADTLVDLSAPGRELFLILGSDIVGDFGSWKRSDEIPLLCTLAVAYRPGSARVDLGPEWKSEVVEIPPLDVSSSGIREMARLGRPLDFLVPEPARKEIVERRLYL